MIRSYSVVVALLLAGCSGESTTAPSAVDTGVPEHDAAGELDAHVPGDADASPDSTSGAAPTVLWRDPGFSLVHDFAIDETSVYWSATSSPSATPIYSCPKSGCAAAGPATVVANGGKALAVHGGRVYFQGRDAYLESCPVADCASDRRKIAPVVDARMLRVLGTNVTFMTTGGTAGTEAIATCPLAGCTSPTTLVSARTAIRGLVVVGSSAFWLESESSGAVYSCPLTGCGGAPTRHVATPYARELATDGTNLYWLAQTSTGSSGTTILRCAASACSTATPVANDPALAVEVNAVGGDVLWVMSPDRLVQAPVDGSAAPRGLGKASGAIAKLLADDTRAWFLIDTGVAEIASLPRR